VRTTTDDLASLVDLSMPLSEGLPRWKVSFESEYGTFCYKTSRIGLSVHTATHLDAPLHYVARGASVDQFPLDLAVCEAAIVDLTHVGRNQAIDTADLRTRFPEDCPEAAILRTDWDRKWWNTPFFWDESPYLTRGAASWLAERRVRIVGYDFPQEYAIRNIAKGLASFDDFVVHDELLSRGIWQLEYLTNLHHLGANRVTLLVCPLPLVGLEGSPVRVLAAPHM